MKCLKCSHEIDMTIPDANAESYGGSTVTVACEKCQTGNVVTLTVSVKHSNQRLYIGDKDQDDWGAPMNPNPEKKDKDEKSDKLTYQQLEKMVADYNEPAKLMLKEGQPLPTVINYVAGNMFLMGTTDSELAKIIRHQLKHLHDHAMLDIARDSKIKSR